MKTHQTDFSKGSVYRNILEVAVPMTVAQFLNLLYNIVDRMYIGRIEGIGTLALTGVGLCFPIITLITAFTYLFGNGGGPLCAIERGKGNEEEAEKIDADKDYIYTNYEKTEVNSGNYEIDVKIPVININSEEIKSYNDEIKAIFEDKAESILNGGSHNSVYSVDYQAYLNEDILSIIIKSTLKDDLRDYIFQRTKRNPMILPIIMEV